MKILYFGDSPLITTGLAQVSRTIVNALCHDHEVEIIAMNHWPEQHLEAEDLPYKIHPCVSANYRNVESAKEAILKADYDMFIYSADVGFDDIFLWLDEARQKRDIFVVGYVPVDCDCIHGSAFNCLELCNCIITYTEHGKRVISKYKPHLADRINVIPLVCEPEKFFPLDASSRLNLRKELFGIDDDTFLVGCIARNQPRKDLGRLLMLFHEYHSTHPNSALYIHSAQNDLGGSLVQTAQSVGIEIGKEVMFASHAHDVCQGMPTSWLNCLYNCFDVLVSTSTGEGWGLPTTEAMSAKCPVMVPGNTANIEIVGENEERGFLVETGGDISHQQILYGLVNYPRDIVHTDSFLLSLDYIQSYPEIARLRAKKALEWCSTNTFGKIASRWTKLADAVSKLGVSS